MAKQIAIIQGHPDPVRTHLGHALAEHYAEGARNAGHTVRTVIVAELDFPVLRTREAWEQEDAPQVIRQAQETIAWAEHIVVFYPLWLGTMPAMLKAFLEQVLRPGFAIATTKGGTGWRKLLAGRSARVVVTMGMPAFVYRWYFRAHSLKSLERNILRFCGVRPIKETLIGMVEGMGDAKRGAWLDRMRVLGERGR